MAHQAFDTRTGPKTSLPDDEDAEQTVITSLSDLELEFVRGSVTVRIPSGHESPRSSVLESSYGGDPGQSTTIIAVKKATDTVTHFIASDLIYAANDFTVIRHTIEHDLESFGWALIHTLYTHILSTLPHELRVEGPLRAPIEAEFAKLFRSRTALELAHTRHAALIFDGVRTVHHLCDYLLDERDEPEVCALLEHIWDLLHLMQPEIPMVRPAKYPPAHPRGAMREMVVAMAKEMGMGIPMSWDEARARPPRVGYAYYLECLRELLERGWK